MKLDKNKTILIYKLLEIAIFLTFFVWTISLVAESVLPGFISGHLSFLKLTIFISILLIASSLLSEKLRLSHKLEIKKWPVVLMTIFGFIIIFLSLVKFHWLEAFTITAVSLLAMFYFYKIFFED